MEQDLDNLRRKDALRGAETAEISVRLGNYSASRFEGSAMGQAGKRTRHNRTTTVDFQNEATYFRLLNNGNACVECVLASLLSLGFQLTHKATCRGGGCLTRHSHYVRVRLVHSQVHFVAYDFCRSSQI
jgi:hypothetical protein